MATQTHNTVLDKAELMKLMAETRTKGAVKRTLQKFASGEDSNYVITNAAEYEAKVPASLYSSFSTNLKQLRDAEPDKYTGIVLKKVGDVVFLVKPELLDGE